MPEPDMIMSLLNSMKNASVFSPESMNARKNASAYGGAAEEPLIPEPMDDEVGPDGMTRMQWGGMTIDMRRDFLRSIENRILSGETEESVGPRPWWMILNYQEGDTKSDAERKKQTSDLTQTPDNQYPIG